MTSPVAAYSEPRLKCRKGLSTPSATWRSSSSRLRLDLSLVSRTDAQVAEVLDAHRRALLALGQVGRQALGDLLVDAALEAVLGAVAEQAHARRA